MFVKKFYISDTHFGHGLMLLPEACGRPFRDTGEMDEAMIARWNAVVGAGDIVYHLGDFAMGLGDEARVRGIFHRLRGRKILVLGNHDFKRPGIVHPTLAGLEWAAPPIPAMETTDDGHRVYLSHYAHRTWPGAQKGAFHFYGHCHGELPAMGRSRDVGVDCRDVAFRPRTFKELTRGMHDDR